MYFIYFTCILSIFICIFSGEKTFPPVVLYFLIKMFLKQPNFLKITFHIFRFGGTEAATFCCLSTLQKQVEFENSFDIYMYSKLYHMRRPGIWQTKVSYFFVILKI